MKQKDKHYTAFNEKWFEKNQRIILFVFRIIYKLFPSLLFKSEETKDFGNKKIVKVGTNYATCLVRKQEFKTVFFTDWNYSKMLYNAFKPMWWAMHYWDELVADRWVPRLSFGFSTLEVNPAAGANSPVDGYVDEITGTPTWATIRDAAGDNGADSNAQQDFVRIDGNATDWTRIARSIFLFDTSALGASATISATVLSLYGDFKTTAGHADMSASDMNIYTSTPASNAAIAASDYAQIGTTAQCDTPITYTGFNDAGYNAFTFNATGVGNVSKTSISKFGARNANYDVANTAPTKQAGNLLRLYGSFADNGSNKPKLVVTFSVSSVSNFFQLF